MRRGVAARASAAGATPHPYRYDPSLVRAHPQCIAADRPIATPSRTTRKCCTSPPPLPVARIIHSAVPRACSSETSPRFAPRPSASSRPSHRPPIHCHHFESLPPLQSPILMGFLHKQTLVLAVLDTTHQYPNELTLQVNHMRLVASRGCYHSESGPSTLSPVFVRSHSLHHGWITHAAIVCVLVNFTLAGPTTLLR
ncbi:hypothetical protein C8J57DRAFT_1726540 [Mycena rebaudengoi]|nr:hypothetical protein C8J57DRAFT_1726540 [Mycena rebaudengoi]